MNSLSESSSDLPIISPATMLPVEVVRREEIAPEVVTLSLALPGSEQAPAPYLPGQFVTLAIPTPRQTLHRSYSLSGVGRADQPWEITIKRLQQGTVSSYLYDEVGEGTLLYASLPRGTFTLPDDVPPGAPLVFVAVGSGITPIMGMLRALALLPTGHHPQVQLHYASHSTREIIFRRELSELDPRERWLRQWHYLSADGNRLAPEGVVAKVGFLVRRAHWYMCGPETLKRDLQGLLEEYEVADEQIHAEIFVSQAGRNQASGSMPRLESGALGGGRAGFRLSIAETGATLTAHPQETLLAALERQGYRPEFSCRSGACGVCKLKVLEGRVAPVGEALTAAERRAGYVLSCVAKPLGEVTLASGGHPPLGGLLAAAVPGGAQRSRREAAMRLRLATVLAVGGLVFGSWTLTNHTPASLLGGASSTSGAPTAQPTSPVNTPGGTAPTVVPTTGPQPTLPPGATPQPTATTGGNRLTATPKPATPAATPKPPAPTPTTQSGGSPHH